VDYAVVVALQILSGVATLVIVSLGLAVVFGMMRVINLAHGEFLMLGGYCAVLAHARGVNLWLCILVLPPIVVGLIGVVVERLADLYGRRRGAERFVRVFLEALFPALFAEPTTPTPQDAERAEWARKALGL
jgi:branched-chain amino acid transport system permease protein